MKISFFEEFPAQGNLSKIKNLKFNTKIYIAAKSYQEFSDIEKKIKKIKAETQTVYWPILKREEGYYISPFSESLAIKRVFSEVSGKNVEVMLDLEPPLNRKLILKNLLKILRNRKLIKNFIPRHKKVVLCQSHLPEFLLYILGLHYKGKTIKMAYTSFFNKSRKWKDNLIRKLTKKSKLIGLGCIGRGILGDEKELLPEELNRELIILKEEGTEEAIIFRLGGLNKQHIKIINTAKV